MAAHLILGQKVRGQGPRVAIAKCKKRISGDRVAGVSLHSIECPLSSKLQSTSSIHALTTSLAGVGYKILFCFTWFVIFKHKGFKNSAFCFIFCKPPVSFYSGQLSFWMISIDRLIKCVYHNGSCLILLNDSLSFFQLRVTHVGETLL